MEPMKLMMVCPRCNGQGYEMFVGVRGKVCSFCQGEAVINPPQQVLEDLECAEIERELLEKYSVKYDITCPDGKILQEIECEDFWFKHQTAKPSKLESLKTMKRLLLEGRGAE